ncbi:ATPase, T2SS/T4P/T4SS family [Gemmatimonadota bacterium]
MKPRPKILGQLLLETGAVSKEELEAALSDQARSGKRLGALLVDHGVAKEEEVARCLSIQLNLPYETPPLQPEPSALELIRPDLARAREILPLSVTPRVLRVAMADPLDLTTMDDLQFQCGRRVDPVVASPSAIVEGQRRGYEGEIAELLEALPAQWSRGGKDQVDALERAARSAPVVRLVDHILSRAVTGGASDIHIEEHRGEIRVRYRVDGVLGTALGLPQGSHEAVLSRLKIMAGMDISVKRKPQDGGMTLRGGDRGLSLRVSTLPLKGGEKAVIRILDSRNAFRNLDDLGLSPEELQRVRLLLRAGQGVILSAGPTGSGKSSTLFAAMRELDRDALNLVTLEDPVEYRLAGANQVQVNTRAGLTFPAALRSVLRQDPDVIMVGEIRDKETAEIAMAAAVTGHLVLSTIHTMDAPGAITRLLNMGVPPFLLAGGLTGVLAQRLVRRLCPVCQGREGKGCRQCSGGYRGRSGVFQVLTMSDALREAVVQGASISTLQRLAREAGMGTLKGDALRKVAEGVTSPHEAGRVIQGDAGAQCPCRACGEDVPAGAVGCPWCGSRRTHQCPCGEEVRPEWRFCPACLRKGSSK